MGFTRRGTFVEAQDFYEYLVAVLAASVLLAGVIFFPSSFASPNLSPPKPGASTA